MTIKAAPMATGARFPAPGSITAMPMARTRKKVPMNSTRYFFIRVNQFLNIVTAAGGRAAFAGPVRVEKFAAWLVHTLVSVRAEIIALRLQQVRRQNRRTILIVKRKRRAERRNGYSLF